MVDKTLADMEFLDRVQKDFEPEEMTQIALEDWLYPPEKQMRHTIKWGKDKKGGQRTKEVTGSPIHPNTRRLASKLSETKDLYDEADVRPELSRLRSLREEVSRETDFDTLKDLQKDVEAEARKVRVDISNKSDRLKSEVDRLAVHKEKIRGKVEVSAEEGLEQIEKEVRKVSGDVKQAERIQEEERRIAERIAERELEIKREKARVMYREKRIAERIAEGVSIEEAVGEWE